MVVIALEFATKYFWKAIKFTISSSIFTPSMLIFLAEFLLINPYVYFGKHLLNFYQTLRLLKVDLKLLYVSPGLKSSSVIPASLFAVSAEIFIFEISFVKSGFISSFSHLLQQRNLFHNCIYLFLMNLQIHLDYLYN